jgi:hypothetical protein
MKYLILALLLSGCAAVTVPMGDDTWCAKDGYFPAGKNFQSSSGGAYSSNGTFVAANTSSNGVQCSKPENKYEACMIDMLYEPTKEIIDYNNGAGTRKMIR